MDVTLESAFRVEGGVSSFSSIVYPRWVGDVSMFWTGISTSSIERVEGYTRAVR